MSSSIAQRLVRLASLAAQRRYVVRGTAQSYYLPEELLNDAYEAVRMASEMVHVRKTLAPEAAEHIAELERLLDGVELNRSGGLVELIESDAAWRAAREHAAACLALMKFDLRHWERSEGID